MVFKSKTVTPENARIRLENLCVRSEHCEWELREKLRGWNVPSSETEAILKDLQKSRFYDNRRFTVAFVRDRMIYNKWGKKKIALALIAKRIPRELISEALSEIEEGVYRECLVTLMRAKAARIEEGNSYEGRTKLFRAMASRGFETVLISDIMRKERIWPEQVLDSDETDI